LTVSKALLILAFAIAVALAATVLLLSSIEDRSHENPSLTRKVFSSDVFEVEVFYPEHVSSGQEVEVKVSAKGREGFMVSAIVFRAYSCSEEPRDLIVIGLSDGALVYENSTRLPQPKSEFSITYRFRLPGELKKWLGLTIWVTPVKPGAPMVIHYTEPIVIPVKVEG